MAGNIIVTALIVIILIVAAATATIIFIINYRHDIKLFQTVSTIDRGTWSERRLVVKLLHLGISSDSIFHDIYIHKYGNAFAQIDTVAVTNVGILVFEVKDYSGWIFGHGYHQYWTQVLAYGREKYRFYNPILQNQGDIDAIRKKLKSYGNLPIWSIIVFYGNCQLRDIDNMPANTFVTKPYNIHKIISAILANNPTIADEAKTMANQILQEAAHNGSDPALRAEHIRRLNRSLNANPNTAKKRNFWI